MTKSEHEPIADTARDYFEGWFDGDTERMERALHPELAKRRGTADGLSPTLTKARMVELTGQGEGAEDATDRTLHIEVLDVSEEIASVVVRSAVYDEYLHMLRTPDGWRIVNALFRVL